MNIMKTIIFILSYSDETYNYAIKHYKHLKWAKVIRIETTILFESIMYDKWLIENYDEWKDYDYIGFLSWKFNQKIRIPNIDKLNDILDKNRDIEFIPLLVADKRER